MSTRLSAKKAQKKIRNASDTQSVYSDEKIEDFVDNFIANES
jgi:hypothetical protein